MKIKLLDCKSLYEQVDIPKDKKIGVVTYHPVTLEFNTSESQITELLQAIEKTEGIYWIFTLTNADTSGRNIINQIRNFIKKHPENTKLYISLAQRKYLSLLKIASLMLGNSSSGLIEAPTFQLPVVNIGDRQKGRIRAANVIDVKESKSELILKAINKAISPEFKHSLKGLENPYGTGNTSEKIVNILKTVCITEDLIKKRFFEVDK